MKKGEMIKILKEIKEDKLKDEESVKLTEASKKLASLRGKINWEGDLNEMRKSRF